MTDANDVLIILIIILVITWAVGGIGLYYAYEYYKKQPKTHSRILTCPQGVISYCFETKSIWQWLHRSEQTSHTNSKIRSVLDANPEADLKALEEQLGLTFTQIQLKPADPIFTDPPPIEYPRRPGFLGSDNQ